MNTNKVLPYFFLRLDISLFMKLKSLSWFQILFLCCFHFASIAETEEIVDVAHSLDSPSEVGATHWSRIWPKIYLEVVQKIVQKWTKIHFASIAETEAQQIDPK